MGIGVSGYKWVDIKQFWYWLVSDIIGYQYHWLSVSIVIGISGYRYQWLLVLVGICIRYQIGCGGC